MNGTIYIYFDGFEIGVGLDELNITENNTDDEIFNRAINHLDNLGVPFRDFAGYKEVLPYDVSI